MTLSLADAEAVARECRDAGHNVEVRAEYSGRGMFGRTVPAFVLGQHTPESVIGWAFGRLGLDVDDLPTRSDGMGLGTVVY